MKIDKKTVDMLCNLPDDSLWKMICAIGSASGLDLSSVKAQSVDVSKLRRAMRTMTDEDISRAAEILGSCRKQED